MQFHGGEALTYNHEKKLVPGTVVQIALRNRSVLGVILRTVPEPSFATKPITKVAPYPALPPQHVELISWMQTYYPAPFGAIVRQFLPPVVAFPKAVASDQPDKDGEAAMPPAASRKTPVPPLPPLTPEQQQAIERIERPGLYILHGITGSGKSRVYSELAERTLRAGRSVIVLTPEIGLTGQLASSFDQLSDFPRYTLHSRQSQSERRNTWYSVLAEAPSPTLVMGPRSALFTPLHNVGLVVVDEAHDSAYKNETTPYYRTEFVAAKLASLHKAVCVLGSATPSVEMYYAATAKNRPVIKLTTLAARASAEKSRITHVDLRDKKNHSRSSILSTPLVRAIQDAVNRKEQCLLFMNRRGTAGAILCSNCGWRLVCNHCDIPLTYHADTHSARCHTCGRTTRVTGTCPECKHADIVFKSYGTKAVVEEARRLLPSARISRFDSDTSKDEQLERVAKDLRAGSTDIIIGTQMVAKGFDLPRLSVVGILNADAGLLIPDYTAAERTFQLISQVAGRVGRGHRAGHVFVQSYEPDNPVLRAAARQDWQTFYDVEISERQTYRFPPFVFVLKLWCLRATPGGAETAAQRLRGSLEAYGHRITVEGPAPAFHAREQAKYRWQLIVKSSSRTILTTIIHDLPANWHYDIDPINLL